MNDHLDDWDTRLRTAVRRDVEGVGFEREPSLIAANVIAMAGTRRRSAGALASIATTAVLFAVAAIAVVAGAGRPPSQADQLLDGTWQLEAAVVDGSPLQLLSTNAITIAIDDSRVSGRAACNLYTSTLSRTDTAIQIQPPGRTKRLCEQTVLDLQNAYLATLPRVQTARAEDQDLVLIGVGVELRYTAICDSDRPSQLPDQPIEPRSSARVNCVGTQP
jgi:heat shock protein HslJ